MRPPRDKPGRILSGNSPYRIEQRGCTMPVYMIACYALALWVLVMALRIAFYK